MVGRGSFCGVAVLATAVVALAVSTPPLAAQGVAGDPAAVKAAASSCPRQALGAMLRSATAPGDVHAALALEREVLRLCENRQKLAIEIVKLERDLAQLLPAVLPPPAPPAPERRATCTCTWCRAGRGTPTS